MNNPTEYQRKTFEAILKMRGICEHLSVYSLDTTDLSLNKEQLQELLHEMDNDFDIAIEKLKTLKEQCRSIIYFHLEKI